MSEEVRPQPTSWMSRLREFTKDVRVEFTRVSWPTRAELQASTSVVIVTVLLVSVFLLVVDRILTLLLGLAFR
jgi:preprotein translocase subunit SecE